MNIRAISVLQNLTESRTQNLDNVKCSLVVHVIKAFVASTKRTASVL